MLSWRLFSGVRKAGHSLRVAFSHRDFALLATGQLFGQTATSMQQVVVAWQIYELTGSPLSVGLTGLFRAIPVILFSLLGGIIADSIDRKRVLLATQSVTLAAALGLATLTSTGLISTLAIYMGVLVTGAATSFDFPARRALVPALVQEAAIAPAATSMLLVRRGSAVFGPTVGGAIISVAGISAAHWGVALSIVVLIACLVVMRSPKIVKPASSQAGVALFEGFRFLWSARALLGILVMAFFLFMFVNSRSVWPALVKDIFDAGPTALGLLTSSASVGTIVGLGIALALGDVRRKGLVATLCAMGLGVCTLGISNAPSLHVVAVTLFVFGVIDSINDSARHTLIATLTPHHLQGRVNSVATVFGSGGVSLGDVWLGFLASALGVRLGLAVAGACVVVGSVLVMLLARPFLRYESGPPRAS